MRTFGGLLLLAGAVLFVYSADRIPNLEPVPEGLTISQSLQYPAGRWEVARYAGAGMAVIGLVLALYPRGR